MKREITLGQLLSVGVTILIALITGWVTLNNKVTGNTSDIKNNEIRMMDHVINSDKQVRELKDSQAETNQTVKETNGTVNEIKVLLERKADRR